MRGITRHAGHPAICSRPQALVAFTIEFDNEAEHRIPHRTTNFGAASHGDGAWLVSMVMWENCMRFVTEEPITVGDLLRLTRTTEAATPDGS